MELIRWAGAKVLNWARYMASPGVRVWVLVWIFYSIVVAWLAGKG